MKEGRDTYNLQGKRNDNEQKPVGSPDLQHISFLVTYGLFLSNEPILMIAALVHGSSASVCACVCACTVNPWEGTACGQLQGQHCLAHVAQLPGLSDFF